MPDVRRPGRAWLIGGSIAVAIVIVGGALTASALSPGADGRRTAVATTGPVEQTLTLSGTISRPSQLTASFPTTGTVTAVSVKVGDVVQSGQVLATMDTGPLNAAVLSAKATLAQDEDTLARDEATTSSGSTGSTASTGAATSASRSTSVSRSAGSGGSNGTAAALTKLRRALALSQAACAPVLGGGGGAGASGHAPGSTASGSTGAGGTRDAAGGASGTAPVPTPAPTASPTPTPSPTPSPSPSPSSPPPSTGGTTGGTTDGTPAGTVSASAIAACQRAMMAADRALQQAATTVQQALSSATRAASAAAAQAAARAAGQAGGGGSSSSGSSASRASRVASDEVAILQDQSAVSQAQSDVTAATLTAPEGGTVARVDYAAGQSASSGSGIVIVGAGPATVTVDVPLSDMSLVKPGLTASVTPSGAAASAAGTVTSVDLVPASSSSSTPAYPARVDVAVPTAAMAPGAGAVVVIAIQTVPDAVRVPASALSGVTAGTGSVTVISGSAGTPTRVSVGAIGGGWAQITKGLTSGQRVLIADPAQPLPSNTTVTGRFGGGGLGGGAGFIRRATGG